MRALTRIAEAADAVSRAAGAIATAAVLAACLISSGNAASRYALGLTSNAWLEVQWYLFAVIAMLGAAETLRRGGHVRVDLLYAVIGDRGRIWIDLLGLALFLLPGMVIFAWLSWPYFWESWVRNEISNNPGGLLRWPAKLLLPIGFSLVAIQGVAELLKRIAALRGAYSLDTTYNRPLQ